MIDIKRRAQIVKQAVRDHYEKARKLHKTRKAAKTVQRKIEVVAALGPYDAENLLGLFEGCETKWMN